MLLGPEVAAGNPDFNEFDQFEILRSFGDLILQDIGFGIDRISVLRERAARNGTDIQEEIFSWHDFDEDAYFRKMAKLLSLPFMPMIDPERVIIRERNVAPILAGGIGPNILLYREREGRSSIVVAPRHTRLYEFVLHLCRYPGIRARIRIARQSDIRRAIAQCGEAGFLDKAVNFLVSRKPEFSAQIVASAWQGAILGAFAVALPVLGVLFPLHSAILTHAFFSIFFLSCVYLRCAAATAAAGSSGKYHRLPQSDWKNAPKYTILVPLYREGAIVADLIAALSRIEWPRSKLEVKLVCEADDLETLDAIKVQNPPRWIETVAVPASHPRTKPKALNYAMQLTTGELVCVYDAEDRPHPGQLLEAWQRFAASQDDLACVQAPLVIGNFGQNMLARLFAFEYAALFRGIVPWLSDGGKIFPLGGTSNHFRRSALETIGCWDPHNVTEDADMGIRLLRHGFRISTISRPTLEDAPDNLTDWLKQRTRWYKGWMQTWLVHNRSPAVLRRDIGTSSFIFSQILFAGMIVSALVHPAFLFSIGELLTQCISGQHLGRLEIALAIIDTSNIVLAYSAFLLLGYRTLTACEKYGFFGLAIRVPLYWLAISIAAWRALFQLVRNPFLWEKTPHKRHYQQGGKMFRSPRSNENPTTAI